MRHAFSLPVFSGLLALALAGCSGSGSGSASLRVDCGGGEAFCLISCDLGCTQTGCAVTEIAENQRLKFSFSDGLDLSSVNSSSVSLRTLTGVAPEGDLLVSGRDLTFVPRVRTVNGVSTFGFHRNESYIIALSGGPSSPFGVRSVSGDRLTKEFACTVFASRGILDDDQLPPRVEMVAPTNLTAAPLVPTIVLRFSELIDTTPLRGSLTTSSPIRYTLRRAINTLGVLTCDRDAQGTVLEGIPRLSTERVGDHDVTVVTFTPTVQLPGASCVEVLVTADLRDLSGRQAVPALFEFFTEAGISTPITISEPFAAPTYLDVQMSGGTWLNGAHPGLIGGDGRHGTFDPAVGTLISSTEYLWNTTSITIPASKSLEGIPYDVTDGKFYFTDFTLGAGITIDFVGPVPPQIYVRGKAIILGTIRLNGATMTTFNARGVPITTPAPYIAGQPGGVAGAGGGRGGNGGNEYQHLLLAPGPGTLQPTAANNGQRGLPVQLLAGHAYVASAVNTGGAGSPMNPSSTTMVYQPITTPQQAPLQNPQLIVYRSYFALGGGGGGFATPGTIGTWTPFNGISTAQGNLGAGGAAGVAFSLFPYPLLTPIPGYSSLNHFVVGGSGGGGGGTTAFGTINVPITVDVFVAGAGGSGGGGALALRSGNTMTVAGSASLQAKGGAGVQISGRDPANITANANWGVACPGGGGSGGSFLLQSGVDMVIGGTIDTRGGNGSSTGNIATGQFAVLSQAGAGATGTYRLEAVTPITFGGTSFPTHAPATHIGTLTDRDPLSGCVSLWRSTNLVFPPQWLNYELDVDNDGNGTVDITYTDTGAAGTQMANDPNGPVVIKFQGARVAQSTGLPIEGTTGPWRFGIGSGGGPGISLDDATGLRFMMTFNTGLFPNCVVRGLRVSART